MEKQTLPNEKGKRNQYVGKVAKRKLTAKEKAFAKEYAMSKNGTQSALKVYDTDSANVASTIASENLTKPRIRHEIESLLNRNNVTIDKYIKEIWYKILIFRHHRKPFLTFMKSLE